MPAEEEEEPQTSTQLPKARSPERLLEAPGPGGRTGAPHPLRRDPTRSHALGCLCSLPTSGPAALPLCAATV